MIATRFERLYDQAYDRAAGYIKLLMPLKGEKPRCRMQVRCERELAKLVGSFCGQPHLQHATQSRYQLGMHTEALALNVLKAFLRQQPGATMHPAVVTTALHVALTRETKEVFIPNQPNLQRLYQLAQSPQPPKADPWKQQKAAE
jgi:hypothetical protein